MKKSIFTMKSVFVIFLIIFTASLLSQSISCSSPNGKNPANTPGNSEVVETEPEPITPAPSKSTFAEEIASHGKPVMVDFGMESCVPCKMMVPILEELETNYSQDVKIIFVHVANEQAKTKEFVIQMIPTQVFFDASWKELERHTGFMSKEDILATFEKHGIIITK